jgi:predicted nucleotidyltransferase
MPPFSGSDTSRMESGFRRRAGERKQRAVRLAVKALQDLEAIGIQAWVVGSLAKGRFSPSSDVDFVVNCPREREYDAFRTIEKAMDGFPFHMVPGARIQDDALPFMMEGAIDAPSLIAREA